MSKRTCITDGCERTVSARGWCKSHYNAWYNSGGLTDNDRRGVGAPTVLQRAKPDEVDEVVVERILAGQNQPANVAERLEVIRRWLASGRTVKSLDALTGWNVNRYRRILRANGIELTDRRPPALGRRAA